LDEEMMKLEKLVLTALCAVVGAWTIKMLVGVVGLSRPQDVPALLAALELSMFFGAALLPLITVWFFETKKKKWLYLLWAPCILYVIVLAFRYSLISPLGGGLRLLIWTAIIVLFVRESKKSKPVQQDA